MKTRQKMIAGFATAAVVLGVGGGIVAMHAVGNAWPSAVQGPTPAVPGNGPDIPGQPDLPEPGDAPDAAGQ
jgi:hypothetical protein